MTNDSRVLSVSLHISPLAHTHTTIIIIIIIIFISNALPILIPCSWCWCSCMVWYDMVSLYRMDGCMTVAFYCQVICFAFFVVVVAVRQTQSKPFYQRRVASFFFADDSSSLAKRKLYPIIFHTQGGYCRKDSLGHFNLSERMSEWTMRIEERGESLLSTPWDCCPLKHHSIKMWKSTGLALAKLGIFSACHPSHFWKKWTWNSALTTDSCFLYNSKYLYCKQKKHKKQKRKKMTISSLASSPSSAHVSTPKKSKYIFSTTDQTPSLVKSEVFFYQWFSLMRQKTIWVSQQNTTGENDFEAPW